MSKCLNGTKLAQIFERPFHITKIISPCYKKNVLIFPNNYKKIEICFKKPIRAYQQFTEKPIPRMNNSTKNLFTEAQITEKQFTENVIFLRNRQFTNRILGYRPDVTINKSNGSHWKSNGNLVIFSGWLPVTPS